MSDFNGGSGADVIVGTEGEDNIDGGAGNDTLRGGGGTDYLLGQAGDDILEGGDGDDFVGGGAGFDRLYGGAGRDSLYLEWDAADQMSGILDGGDGADTLNYHRFEGSDGQITLIGGAGADTISADGHADLTISGGDGNDVVTVRNVGVSTVSLGAGHDRLNASQPYDSPLGTYLVRVTDFAAGDDGDHVYLGGVLGPNWPEWDGHTTINPFLHGVARLVQSGDDAVLQIRAGSGVFHDVIRFESVSAAAFTAQNFMGFPPDGGPTRGYTVHGTEDDDVAVGGGEFNDVVIGLAGDDALYGQGGDDLLQGGEGDDVLGGRDGSDIMEGGNGDDTLTDGGAVDEQYTGSDVFRGGAGIDTVAYSKGLTLDLSGRGRSTGDAVGDTYSSIERFKLGAGDSVVYGSSGNDWIILGFGSVNYMGGNGFDVLEARAPDYVTGCTFNMENGTLFINGFFSSLDIDFSSVEGVVGLIDGQDFFYGSSRDEMFDGNVGPARDTVVYDGNSTDFVIRTAGGVTTVWSAATGTDTLYNIEDLKFLDRTVQLRGPNVIEGFDLGSRITTGDEASMVYGRGGNDVLTTGAGADLLDGGVGVDVMAGGRGDDVYYVDEARDVVAESRNEGTDVVYSSVSYVLAAGVYVEGLRLTGPYAINGTGNGIANVITGNGAANILDGGKGDDTLIGGKGDDTYYVDSNSDVVTEKNGQGTDQIISSVSFAMKSGSYVENLTLTGTANLNATGNGIANLITGNGGANSINGGAGNDTLHGGAGNDTLNGGASGSDRMYGGLGNDVFHVNSSKDKAYEAKGSGSGTDWVYSSVDYSLKGQYIEYLTLTGSADVYAKGNTLDNRLVGNAGDNRINGMEGQDRLTGGAGSDTFIWDATSHSKVNDSDRVTDLSNADFIDLSRIDANVNASGSQHFVLVDAFSHTAGQVMLKFDGTYTNLTADTNGDGVADMLIRIDGDHTDFDNFIFGG